MALAFCPGKDVATLRLQHASRLAPPVGVAGADREVHPFIGERLGDGTTDAAARAGDHRLLPLQSQVHRGSPLLRAVNASRPPGHRTADLGRASQYLAVRSGTERAAS